MFVRQYLDINPLTPANVEAIPTAAGAVTDNQVGWFATPAGDVLVYIFKAGDATATTLDGANGFGLTVAADDGGGCWYLIFFTTPTGNLDGTGRFFAYGGLDTAGGGIDTKGGAFYTNGAPIGSFGSATSNQSLAANNLVNRYTGTGAIYTLPDVGTPGPAFDRLGPGARLLIIHDGTGTLTVKKFGGSVTLCTLSAGQEADITAIAAGSPPTYRYVISTGTTA